MYSLLPGGLDALPSFKDTDFKLPSDVAPPEGAKSSGCFRVSRALDPEHSSDSDTDSPRHAEAAVCSTASCTAAPGVMLPWTGLGVCTQTRISNQQCKETQLVCRGCSISLPCMFCSQASREEAGDKGKQSVLRSSSSQGGNLLMRILSRKSNKRRQSMDGALTVALHELCQQMHRALPVMKVLQQHLL